MKGQKNVLNYLHEQAEKIEIPESITPKQIQKKLEMDDFGGQSERNDKGEQSDQGEKRAKSDQGEKREKSEQREKSDQRAKKQQSEQREKSDQRAKKQQSEQREQSEQGRQRKKRNKIKTELPIYLALAACFCLLVGVVLMQKTNFVRLEDDSTNVYSDIQENKNETEELASLCYPRITYEDIYESMFGSLEENGYYGGYRGELTAGITDSFQLSEAEVVNNVALKEYAASEKLSSGVLADAAVNQQYEAEESLEEYGTTNVQTVGVEEADVVKNDGRYLYQKIYQEKENIFEQAIQIVDTRDGLKEVKRIEGFENIQEFYVWEDVLVIIENKYLQVIYTDTDMENKVIMCESQKSGNENLYHEITFYNIKERQNPYKIKTFTLKGKYDSSRIAEGYFYGFSKFYAVPGEGENDYASYIPQVEGVQLKADQILLPEENKGNCYLVLISIDMKNPTKFVDTTAIITESEQYYVSSNNIYIADSLGFQQEVGKQTNQISLFRFSYESGKFSLKAQGKVPGNLESSFSMDEYNEKLRMVTTVNEYWFEELKDDRTGEVIGNCIVDENQSNALYVLDSELNIIGKIENLAEDERIYSARFLGETGYFVTFRETDPLFAVDLKNPRKPRILSELKISGFSEYLHFYGEDRLLGIGMEADEQTGRTEGMKLSMFDISEPKDVKEVTKIHLDQYDYSEALYNHRAVMISVGANIFGFEAEGYENGNYKKDYLVFSYEEDEFVQKLKVETKNKYGEIYSSRGTFIGNIFYLLTRDGSVRSYDLKTGKSLEYLE